ncbi:TonB-dependent receptor plug domain-containing protein [Flavobacterium pallidum]|uniref:TonB-dependent receptor n=1 Tax=Flavobacterium pallidum TaxID=2172098 RepID=A0A2S1SDK2_9FLAO|nr:TonB-dependent receptor [Flavobacterium pallidum]AWI24478.1 TonB-dependent receptor [Flavobacterium pallidum]
MKPNLSITILLFLTLSVSAQEKTGDSLKTAALQEVVITGQFEPQALKKSVYNVRVITKDDIKQLAANNLSDVLNQYLNISIRTSGSDGRSQVSMFGLDAQYFKILVDNIPLVSDTGLGNNIDLTQVNLDDVEQIEIIEGSMAVTHGANAVTGVLNIITKKKSAQDWEVSATAQEETVSDEFAFFDKGRHIQSFKISHNFNSNWFVSTGFNRNDFAGYYANSKGKDYSVNDGLRGHVWLPKEQLATNILIGYRKNDFRFFYKFDYFGENVDFYNPIVIPQDNYPFPETYYTNDRRYISNRFYHHLNAYGKLFFALSYNVSVSHQRQQRDFERFNYQLETQQESANKRENYQSKEVFYSTGTLSNFFKNKSFDLQLGYEAVSENGFYDSSAGIFKDDNQQLTNIRKRLENYDFFASAEINMTAAFSIRPGLRYSFQSKFDDQYAASLGLRYLFAKGIEARISIGKSYRTPNFDELYTYFVDSNHNLQGNENLSPETGMSYEASVKKNTFFESGTKISNTLAVTLLDVDDRISLVLDQITPAQRYKYLNIDSYKMWNIATTNQFSYKNWNTSLGLALVGISQKIDLAALNTTSDDRFLYTLQINSSVSYNIPKWNVLLAIYCKYNGRQQQYVSATDINNNATFLLSEIDAYSWMDTSVRKDFLSKKLEVTLGARNLFDVKTVRMTTGTTGIHAAGSDMLLGYGRSAFLKLTYNLNFNK